MSIPTARRILRCPHSPNDPAATVCPQRVPHKLPRAWRRGETEGVFRCWEGLVGWFVGCFFCCFFGCLRWGFLKSVQKFELSSLFFFFKVLLSKNWPFEAQILSLALALPPPKKLGWKWLKSCELQECLPETNLNQHLLSSNYEPIYLDIYVALVQYNNMVIDTLRIQ